RAGARRRRRAPRRGAAPVGIVSPVHDEERSLLGCPQVLCEHLSEEFPFSWAVAAVGNASAVVGRCAVRASGTPCWCCC
ncbi:hypothetical protein LH612_36750, partial [Klebsiella pneumoniae]|nr:hypothetical protein [Klebsiella pneumoniae]